MRGIFLAILMLGFSGFAQNATKTFYVVPPLMMDAFEQRKIENSIDEFFALNNLFVSRLKETENQTYSYALDTAMLGTDEENRIVGIYGIYFDEGNLDYLKYVPVYVGGDPVYIVYGRVFSESFEGLDNMHNLLLANVPVLSLLGVPPVGILKDRNMISCKLFEQCMERILNEKAIFVASGQMLRAFLRQHPEYKNAIGFGKLLNGEKAVVRPLYFAFNRDYAETLEFNSQVFQEFIKLLESFKPLRK